MEWVPKSEESLEADECLVHCCHCQIDNGSVITLANPFWIRLKRDGTLGDFKKMVQMKLQIPDEAFAQWRFAHYALRKVPLELFADDDEGVCKFLGNTSVSINGTTYLGDSASFIAVQHRDITSSNGYGAYDGTDLNSIDATASGVEERVFLKS